MPLEFVDTNILIYAHDGGAGAKHTISEALIERLNQSSEGAVSTHILAEFYLVATKKIRRREEDIAAIVADFGAWTVHRLAHSDLLAAMQLHRRYKISWCDALVLQSAHALGCEILWTEDLSHGQRYGSLIVRNPFR
ncbi:MAG: PIN domain-containing protein [Bryobacterales bacterium]|nr:PIN domain-containing protein [Bryobacterales bacterium]MBV9397210.1 PIN domain-containing protein [Bryobacterales bacterium]